MPDLTDYQWRWLARRLRNGDEIQFGTTIDGRICAILKRKGWKEQIIRIPRTVIPFPVKNKKKSLREKLNELFLQILEEI